MPEHQFSYPRVVPVTDRERRPAANGAAPARTAPRSQRELVAASLVRCPPPGGLPPRRVTR